MPKPKATIGCKVSKNGRVTVTLIKKGKPFDLLPVSFNTVPIHACILDRFFG
jgi:hypothetical protein